MHPECVRSKHAPHTSKMANDRHLKKSKNLNIFATDGLIMMKFGMLVRIDSLDPISQ